MTHHLRRDDTSGWSFTAYGYTQPVSRLTDTAPPFGTARIRLGHANLAPACRLPTIKVVQGFIRERGDAKPSLGPGPDRSIQQPVRIRRERAVRARGLTPPPSTLQTSPHRSAEV